MTGSESWAATSHALDHHATVEALVDAMSVTEADTAQDTAEQMTVWLAKQGLVLVPVNEHSTAKHLADDPSWFERKAD